MKKSIKLSLTGLSVTSLAVGAGLTSQHLKNKPSPQKQNIQTAKRGTNKRISEWLKSKGNKVILSAHDTTKSDVWKTKWENFKKWYEENNPTNEWQIFGWVTKKENGEGYTKFQELCKSNSEKETYDQDAKLVIEVIKHCVEDSN